MGYHNLWVWRIVLIGGLGVFIILGLTIWRGSDSPNWQDVSPFCARMLQEEADALAGGPLPLLYPHLTAADVCPGTPAGD